jgi:hypothetical protein
MGYIISTYDLVKPSIIYKKLNSYLMLVNTKKMNNMEIYFEVNHKWLVKKIKRIKKRFHYIYSCLLTIAQVKTARIVFRVNNLMIIEYYSNEKKTVIESYE